MKRLRPDRFEEKLEPLSLYLDDLCEIEQFLREHCETLVIEVADNSLDSMSEIPNLKLPAIHKLKIKSGVNDHIYIWFFPTSAKIESWDKSDKAWALCAKLYIMLSKKASPWQLFLISYSLPLNAIAAGIYCIGFIYAIIAQDRPFFDLMLVATVFLFSYLFGTMLYRSRYVIIYPYVRGDGSTFWKRHGDAIVKYVIGAVITLVVSWFLGPLLHKLAPSYSTQNPQPSTNAAPK